MIITSRQAHHLTVTSSWRPVCPTSRTVLGAHTVCNVPNCIRREAALTTYMPARTRSSRGRATRISLSLDASAGYGGSGSKFRGKIPGSRKACSKRSSVNRCETTHAWLLITHGRTHA